MSLEQEHILKLTAGKYLRWLVWFYLLLLLVNVLLAPLWPLQFSPNETDLSHIYQPPFAFEFYQAGVPFHWLGTDGLGRDVLANLVLGGRTAILVSIPVMGMATLLGVWLGAAAGYFGNRQLRMRYTSALLYISGLFALFFYSFYLRQNNWQQAAAKGLLYMIAEAGNRLLILAGILAVVILLKKVFRTTLRSEAAFRVPLDNLVVRLVALVTSVPRLLLILSVSAFAGSSFGWLLALVVVTYWTGPARLVRAEVLKIKALPYTEAARVAGLSDAAILWRHILPNAITPVLVAFGFGAAGLLTLESTLSFLGIGIPADLPSWGRLISGFRQNMEAWWLLLVPGIALCTTILGLQTGVQWLIKNFDPKQHYR